MASQSNESQPGTAAASPSPPREGIVLAGCLVQYPDGLFVDTQKLSSAEELERAVDGVFTSGHYFSGLDYGLLQRLLYDFAAVQGSGLLQLAGEIREFPAARRGLYRTIKIKGGEAEYMFEPVLLESTVDEPVYGTGEDGESRVTGSQRKVVSEKARLDVDEFVADLWTKGVRFGIDVDKVRTLIEEERCERAIVARDQAPTPGSDAGIKEQTPELHRDNAPRELPNGRVDLGQFQNRFPQMTKGAALLMKTPPLPGKPGRTLGGKRLEPPLPKDFDLTSLAGEGTRIEAENGCEYIVAAMDGFLNLDNGTNRISITEKIINRDGVSARTTGNLALAGDEYEEFGEVQEGRVVEGKGLTFHANVYGKVVSSGGNIDLLLNLVGGSAVSARGSITVAGLASNAVVETRQGVLRLKRAENSLLVGDRVEVEWASNCTVLAAEVEIGVSAGCAIAGRHVHVGAADARSGQETLVSMLLPDFSGIDLSMKKEQGYLAECEELMAKLKAGVDHLANEPELRRYLAMAGRIHRKEITLTAEQQGQWQHMVARFGPALKRITQVREDIKALEGEMEAVRGRIGALAAEKARAVADVECHLESVQGEVVVRTLTIPMDATPLVRLPPRELKQRLSAPDADSRLLFSGSGGQFDWTPEPS